MSTLDERNPYVGPRAFEEGEAARFFGREREREKLLHLLLARRLVLLHAPSGAGKSSLVRAGLIPRLRERDFLVRPVIRVGLEAGAGQGANRFRVATLLSLDEGRPPTERLSADELASLSLSEYLARSPAPDDGEEVLIFDQFEELLSADPTDRAAKEAFAAELGALLENPRRWALFAIREDYLGALKPLLLPIPTRLAATFRLDLLDPEQARQAIQGPALAAGGAFEEDAAAKLIDDLRQTMVQRPDGNNEVVLGQSIEPVQLQVVCYRLWERRAGKRGAGTGSATISLEDVEAAGDVDAALRGYYADQVAAVATASGVDERRIREWVGEQLITETGLRGQILRAPEATGGLANAAIRRLVDAHLVRAEERRGATWYELAHDRLIGPVREDNAAWFEAHLSTLQRQAALWAQAGRPDGLLLRGTALREAEREVDEPGLSEAERTFLTECCKTREAEERERRDARRIRALLAVTLVGLVVALALSGVAWTLYQRAEEQLTIADTLRLAAQAQEMREGLPQRGVLLALEAVGRSDTLLPAAEQALRDALTSVGGAPLRGHKHAITTLTFSPDGRTLVTASYDGTARLWRVDEPQAEPHVLQGYEGTVYTLAFSPDGRTLATGSEYGTARLWRVDEPQAEPHVLHAHTPKAVTTLAFSPDGRTLATGSEDDTVRLWRLDDPQAEPHVLQGHKRSVYTLAFSPDGRTLATGSYDGTVRLWRVDDPQAQPRVLQEAWYPVFSPDGRTLATTGSTDYTVRLWRVDEPQAEPRVLQGHEDWVTTLAFSPDGRTLATGSTDGTARLWRVDDPQAQPRVLQDYEGPIYRLAFSPDGRTLVTSSGDKMVRLWHLNAPQAEPSVLRGHEAPVMTLAFSPDGRTLATGSTDGTARLWRVDEPQAEPRVLHSHTEAVVTLAFSPDGYTLATGSEDDTARLWRLDAPQAEPRVLQGHNGSVMTLAFSPDGRTLATGSEDDTVRLWRLDAPQAEPRVLRGHTEVVWTLAFSPDGRTLATGSTDYTVRLWRVDEPQAEPRVLRGHEAPVMTLAFSPDGRTLATGSTDGMARLWRVDELQAEPRVLQEGDTLAFSPDGRTLATGSTDGTARLWRMDELQSEPRVLQGHKRLVNTLAFSPDGRTLATASYDGTFRLWQVDNPQAEPIVLYGHEDTVYTLAFSPDGRTLATGSEDGTVQLWRMDNPQAEPIVLHGHKDTVTTLAFNPDGRTLATASKDGTVRLWSMPLSDLQTLACTTVGRNLTLTEWQQYLGADRPYHQTCLNLPIHPSVAQPKVDQAAALAQQGEIEQALTAYAQAQQLNPALDPPANWLAGQILNLAQTDTITTALAIYAKVRQLDPALATPDAYTLSLLCWDLSLVGHAAEVLDACEQAVARAPDNSRIRDRRGLARALTGDYKGAIEDFQAFVASTDDEEQKARREAWIASLEAGRNPFDAKTLEALREE